MWQVHDSLPRVVAVPFGLGDSSATTTTTLCPRAPLSPLPVNSHWLVTERLTPALQTPLLSTILQQQHQRLNISDYKLVN